MGEECFNFIRVTITLPSLFHILALYIHFYNRRLSRFDLYQFRYQTHSVYQLIFYR